MRIRSATCKRVVWCAALAASVGIAIARERQPQTAKVVVQAGRAGCQVDLDARPAGTTDAAGSLTLADVDPTDHYLHVRCPGAAEAAYFLSPKERLRRSVINRIMCDGRLDLDALESEIGQDLSNVEPAILAGWEGLADLEADGLCRREGRTLVLTGLGRLLVRVVAMRFDPMLASGQGRYSRTV